jgi:DNA helicase-2/ATP-dependent DNA helicase PcrA
MGYVDLSIGTFHGFCERVLREFGVHIGLSPDFRVMTEVESWLLVRRHIKALNLSYFAPRGNPTKFLQALLDHFSRAKDEGVDATAACNLDCKLQRFLTFWLVTQ